VGGYGRTGPVVSDSSENRWVLRPVVSDWSGGVGVVCGMKRGIIAKVWATKPRPSQRHISQLRFSHVADSINSIQKVDGS
jgi:hypothetical protein